MDCNRLRSILDAYADGELDLQNSLDAQTHLKGCPPCTRELQLIQDSKRAFKSVRRYSAPSDLTAQMAKRHGLGRSKIRLSIHLVWAACLVIATFLGWYLGRAQTASGNLLAMDLVSSHLRSLEGGHLADVASSDKHTVKPWFDGKIDFSPPVVDLKQKGFPLLGGRIDYLEGNRVAVLVYGRAKHLINVYIEPGEHPTPMPSSWNGFNIRSWSQGGFSCVAISDLNGEELGNLEALLKAS